VLRIKATLMDYGNPVFSMSIQLCVDFVLVSSKNLGVLEHLENPRKMNKKSIKSMVLRVWQVMIGVGLKSPKVDFNSCASGI
jgi:hypothetical protein